VAYLAFLALRTDAEAILVDEQNPVPERLAMRQEFADGGLVGRQRDNDRLPRRRYGKSGCGGGLSRRSSGEELKNVGTVSKTFNK